MRRASADHAFPGGLWAPEDGPRGGGPCWNGEQLICDGIELPPEHRKKRLDLEARGLIKGAQVAIWAMVRKPGFSRSACDGAEDPQISAASSKDRKTDEGRAFASPLPRAWGPTVLATGAALEFTPTIHKGAGPAPVGTVQVVCPESVPQRRVWAGLRRGTLWKRLAYCGRFTVPQDALIWVVRNRPVETVGRWVGVDDLRCSPCGTAQALMCTTELNTRGPHKGWFGCSCTAT